VVLVRVDQHPGTAEFGLTIGERHNQGLGSDATKFVLDWAFTVMRLHNFLLVTFSWNLPAIRAYSRAGFREIGGGEEPSSRRQRHGGRPGHWLTLRTW
jgi:RimJ/RimL family protein N-acetyltransferase